MPSLPSRGRAALLRAILLLSLLLAVPPGPARAAASPIALGVNIAGAPDEASVLQGYDHLAGRAPALVMWYQQWSEPLYYPVQMANLEAIGAAPVITWDPIQNGVGIPLQAIVQGRYDAYIRSAAAAAIAYRHIIYIRLGHEMNLSSSGFGPGDQPGDTPAEFVAAWRHVVTIFRRAGAGNVEWVWSPNADCGGKCPFQAFYPGDAWVDWVALDAYNYSSVDGLPWASFAQLFGPSYQQLTQLTSKPVMIGETASAEAGGSKAAWIAQAFLSQIPQQFPHVRAVVWFDRDKETNWMVNSSPGSLLAWRAVVQSPLYSASPAALAAVAPAAGDVDSHTAVPPRVRRHHHRRPHRPRHHRRRPHRRRHHDR